MCLETTVIWNSGLGGTKTKSDATSNKYRFFYLNKLGVETELKSKVNGFFLSWMSLRLKVKADHHEYFLYSWGHSLRHSSYYGGPQLSRQNRKPHGKSKNLTAKAKYPTTKPKTSRQNQRPHGKTKVILLTVKYLVLPWDFLFSLPWGILFLPWGFCFCRDTVVGHHTASIWHKRKTF